MCDRRMLLDVMYGRRSVRRYREDPIPEDALTAILEAGRLAPSANNLQPWHFVVVRDPDIKRRLVFTGWNRFIEEAPAIIVGCGDPSSRWMTVDVAIALENMVIAAEALGLASCWIGAFNEVEVKKILRIPDGLRVVAMIALGYPAEKPRMPPKRRLEEIVHHDVF